MILHVWRSVKACESSLTKLLLTEQLLNLACYAGPHWARHAFFLPHDGRKSYGTYRLWYKCSKFTRVPFPSESQPFLNPTRSREEMLLRTVINSRKISQTIVFCLQEVVYSLYFWKQKKEREAGAAAIHKRLRNERRAKRAKESAPLPTLWSIPFCAGTKFSRFYPWVTMIE